MRCWSLKFQFLYQSFFPIFFVFLNPQKIGIKYILTTQNCFKPISFLFSIFLLFSFYFLNPQFSHLFSSYFLNCFSLFPLMVFSLFSFYFLQKKQGENRKKPFIIVSNPFFHYYINLFFPYYKIGKKQEENVFSGLFFLVFISYFYTI